MHTQQYDKLFEKLLDPKEGHKALDELLHHEKKENKKE